MRQLELWKLLVERGKTFIGGKFILNWFYVGKRLNFLENEELGR